MLEQLDLTAALLLLRTDSCVCCSGEQTDLWSGFGSLFSNKVNVCTEVTPEREFTWELTGGSSPPGGAADAWEPPIYTWSFFCSNLPEIMKRSIFHQRLCRNVMRQKHLLNPGTFRYAESIY